MIRIVPGWLRENFRIKFSLFALAAILWFLVVTEKNFEYTLEIPIVLKNIAKGRMVSNPYPTEAEVRFQASGKQLLRMMYFNRPELQVNMATINFYYEYPIRPEMVVMLGGIEAQALEVVSPDTILFILDEILELDLPVVSSIDAVPAAGYALSGEIEFVPPMATLNGPKERLRLMREISTDSVRLRDVKRNTEIEIKLQKPDYFGITVIPEFVTTLLKVERLSEKKINDVPIQVRYNPLDGVIILDPNTVDVRISGAVSVLSNMKPGDLVVWVDYREFHPRKSMSVPVHVEAAIPIDVLNFMPQEVNLILRKP